MIDTHAHIHFDEFAEDLEDVFDKAAQNDVEAIITVGTDDTDSEKALQFVADNTNQKLANGTQLAATVGLHPHEANRSEDALLTIKELAMGSETSQLPVAIGECGLDYYRNLSSSGEQKRALEFQIELALDQDLPLIFHVRDAWDDFFGIIHNYPNLRGVIHSFTGHAAEVEQASKFDLCFGLNGIMTFTKDQRQLESAKLIPANRLLLETDCPYLSPFPVRGKRNEPANLRYTAEFLADLRGEGLEELVQTTNINAQQLFGL